MPNTISHIYENRRRNLRSIAKDCGGASALAKKLGLSRSRLSQLIGEHPVGEISERIARSIEWAIGLPPGWLDSNTHTNQHSLASNDEPLVSVVLARQASRLIEDFLLASVNDRRALLIAAAEAADRATSQHAIDRKSKVPDPADHSAS